MSAVWDETRGKLFSYCNLSDLPYPCVCCKHTEILATKDRVAATFLMALKARLYYRKIEYRPVKKWVRTSHVCPCKLFSCRVSVLRN